MDHNLPPSHPGAKLAALGIPWAAVLLLGACGGSANPNAPPAGSAGDGGTATQSGVFDVAALVHPPATVARADVLRVFAMAANVVTAKTGERMRLIDVVMQAPGPDPTSAAFDYVAARPSSPPEGVVVFSEDEVARSVGGYSRTFVPPFTFRNEFPATAGVGAGRVYVAVVHFGHPYARCGYDDSGQRISEVSVGGECQNRRGTPCVRFGARYMCATALGDLYAQPDVFDASTIVHEFLHPFGRLGNRDHWGTPECSRRTGMTDAQAANLPESQENASMCPDLFPRFRLAR